jgi:Terminase large subunit, T4likevirus-type, N-terminal
MANVRVNLPSLHPAQRRIADHPARFKAVCLGRRAGKSSLITNRVCKGAVNGKSIGIFVPQYRMISEIWHAIVSLLSDLKIEANKTEGIIRLPDTGGRIKFFSLENPTAGRGEKFHEIYLDEIAFAKDDFEYQWSTAIRPTLTDYAGTAMACSTPNGISDSNFFNRICNDKDTYWTVFKAPSSSNPYLPKEELDLIKKSTLPLIWLQEYQAEFISMNSVTFFPLEYFLGEDGIPEPLPKTLGGVFAVVDTALKTGVSHDSTAVLYCAYQAPTHFESQKVFILDWDLQQIHGALLIDYLPQIQNRIEELIREHQAQWGSLGIFIEDKGSGTVLLGQSARTGIETQAIPSHLTALGKDGRAMAASPYVAGHQIKISKYAYEKMVDNKGSFKNHLLSQILNFRIADKASSTKSDDLLDTLTYASILACGSDGYM